MSKRLLILGTGGYGRAVAEAALMSQEWVTVHFLDDTHNSGCNSDILGRLDQIEVLTAEYDGVVCAIGSNKVRALVLKRLSSIDVTPSVVTHPRAYDSPGASIGAGSTIMAGVVVGRNAQVGVFAVF